jgi:hypothetical protein
VCGKVCDVLRHVLHVEAILRVLAVTQTTKVGSNDREVWGQQRDDVTPVVRRLRHTVQEKKGFSLTCGHVVQTHTVDKGAAMLDRCARVIFDDLHFLLLSFLLLLSINQRAERTGLGVAISDRRRRPQ